MRGFAAWENLFFPVRAPSAWEEPERTTKEEDPEGAWEQGRGASWVLGAGQFKGDRQWSPPHGTEHSEH